MTADLLSIKIAIVSEVASERELVRQAAEQTSFPVYVSEVEVTDDALAMGESLARDGFDVVFFDSRIPKPDRQTVLDKLREDLENKKYLVVPQAAILVLHRGNDPLETL